MPSITDIVLNPGFTFLVWAICIAIGLWLRKIGKKRKWYPFNKKTGLDK